MKNVISVNFKIVFWDGFFYSICFTIFQKYTYRVETFYVPYYVSALVVDTNS